MLFLSQLLNRTVYDSRNEVVGKCVDVFVDPGEGFPAMVALGLLRGGQEYLISAVDLARVDRRGIILSARLRDLTLYERDGEEIGLAHQGLFCAVVLLIAIALILGAGWRFRAVVIGQANRPARRERPGVPARIVRLASSSSERKSAISPSGRRQR